MDPTSTSSSSSTTISSDTGSVSSTTVSRGGGILRGGDRPPRYVRDRTPFNVSYGDYDTTDEGPTGFQRRFYDEDYARGNVNRSGDRLNFKQGCG